MNEPDQPSISSDRRIYIGLAAGLALGVALNLASYFLWVTPAFGKLGIPKSHKMGFPKIFWVESARVRNPVTYQIQPLQSAFYWDAFIIDAIAVLGISVTCAQWYQKRGEASAPTSASPPNDHNA